MAGKIIVFGKNRETAASEDWRAISLPIATLITTCDYLAQHQVLADDVVMTLGDVARDAMSALALQRSVLRTGYSPAFDDGLLRLHGLLARNVARLVGRIHEDYVRLMVQSCEDLERAVAVRRAGRALQRITGTD